jgi:F-type H+-transporting ATPase subunit b
MLRAVPTFILVLLLYLFLKRFFFSPLDQVIQKRYEDTEGAMAAAREALSVAERRTAEHQQALREARAEMFRIQERERLQTQEESATQVRRTRAEAEQRIAATRAALQQELERAKQRLASESEELAESIARVVMKPRAEKVQ